MEMENILLLWFLGISILFAIKSYNLRKITIDRLVPIMGGKDDK